MRILVMLALSYAVSGCSPPSDESGNITVEISNEWNEGALQSTNFYGNFATPAVDGHGWSEICVGETDRDKCVGIEGRKYAVLKIKPEGTFQYHEYFMSKEDIGKPSGEQNIIRADVYGTVKGNRLITKNKTCKNHKYFFEQSGVYVSGYKKNHSISFTGPDKEQENGAYHSTSLTLYFPDMNGYFVFPNKENNDYRSIYPNGRISYLESLSKAREDLSICTLQGSAFYSISSLKGKDARVPASIQESDEGIISRLINKFKALL